MLMMMMIDKILYARLSVSESVLYLAGMGFEGVCMYSVGRGRNSFSGTWYEYCMCVYNYMLNFVYD